MRLGFIVLAHRGPDQVALLLKRLAHPRTRVYFHLDRRVDRAPFDEALRREGVAPSWLPRHATRWGGIEVVDATLAGLRASSADGCHWVMLLSGQDFPVWPTERIVDFADAAGDRSYLSWFSLPDPRWHLDGRKRTECYTYTVRGRRETCLPRAFEARMSWRGRVLNRLLRARSAFRPPRRFPACAEPYGGSQWWNLSAAAVRYVLDFLDAHPEYRAYHEHTLLPDELFFQSILLGTDFADGHELVNDSLRFMAWEEGASHPRTLGVADLPAILESGQPVARKFDAGADREVLDRLLEVGA